MKNSVQRINSFEECLKIFCKPAYDSLQEGLSSAQIQKLLSSINVHNDDLVALYAWRNGIMPNLDTVIGKYDVCSFGKMLSLDKTVQLYKKASTDALWEKQYFPILGTGGGDYLLLDVDEYSKTHGSIYLYSPSLLIVEPELLYDNLNTFFLTVIECYHRHVYTYDATSQMLDINYTEEANASSKINRKAEYWNQ